MRTFYFRNAGDFAAALRRMAEISKRREAQLFTRVVNHTARSLRFGSSTTGAPGQPFRSGNLRDVSFYKRGSVAERDVSMGFDTSIAPYAPIIEDALNGITLRSKVGGFHSIKITQLNFRYIVEEELNAVLEQIPFA